MLVALCVVVFGLGFIAAITTNSSARSKSSLGKLWTWTAFSNTSGPSTRGIVKAAANKTERVIQIDDGDLMTR
jgi:hypothetical protein